MQITDKITKDIASDLKWLRDVKDMLIEDLERVNRAQAEELICYRLQNSN